MTEQDHDYSRRESLNKDFLDQFGIDPGSAAVLFDIGPFKTMLEHMYYETIEALRDCDMDTDGRGIQGQAQLLWALLNVPKRLEELKDVE